MGERALGKGEEERSIRSVGSVEVEEVPARIRGLRRRVIERDGLICQLCSEPLLSEADVTLDHVVPRSKGGVTSFANLRVACAPCNFARGNGDGPDPALRAKIAQKLGGLVFLPPRAQRRGRAASIGAPTLKVPLRLKLEGLPIEAKIAALTRERERLERVSFEEKLAAQKQDEERLERETILKGVG